jgi:hypothetical protein
VFVVLDVKPSLVGGRRPSQRRRTPSLIEVISTLSSRSERWDPSPPLGISTPSVKYILVNRKRREPTLSLEDLEPLLSQQITHSLWKTFSGLHLNAPTGGFAEGASVWIVKKLAKDT